MNAGWHARVPVLVSNPYDTKLTDAVVGFDLGIADILRDAGWATSRQGAALRLESFVLDELSVRVIEYRNLTDGTLLGGQPIGEVPARATPGAWQAQRTYNARTQPDVHVEWLLPGATAVGAVRYFMIYFDTITNGVKPPALSSEDDSGPLASRYWIGRGTTLYGRAQSLTLMGAHAQTSITVEILRGTAWSRIDIASLGLSAVLPIHEPVTVVVADRPELVRIRANAPLVALGTSEQLGRFGGFVPSLDGSLRGTEFNLPAFGMGYLVFSPTTSARVAVDGQPPTDLAPNGLIPIQTMNVGQGGSFVHPRAFHRVTSDGPIMVMAWPNATGPSQFVTHAGAPAGTRLVGLPYQGKFCSSVPQNPNAKGCAPNPQPPCTQGNLAFEPGQLIVGSLATRASVRGRDLLTGDITLPTTPNGLVTKTPGMIEEGDYARFPVAVTASGSACPMLVYSTKGATDEAFGSEPIVAYGGPAVPPSTYSTTTPIGGTNALQFHTPWPVDVIAFYNDTQVNSARASGASARGLAEGGVFGIDASIDDPASIIASKPVALIPKAPGAFFAGTDHGLRPEILGPGAYRGYLVTLDPVDRAVEPMISATGPGVAVEYAVVARNLAKDAQGRGVEDTFRLSVEAPPLGWQATLSTTSLRVAGGGNATFKLRVTPPSDAPEGASLRLALKVTSAGNANMTDAVSTITFVRTAYAVDAWLEKEGGPRSQTQAFERAQRRTETIVVKNLAAVPDRFSISAQALAPGWLVGEEKSGATITEIALEPGATRAVRMDVSAPNESSATSLVEFVATSLSDASVAAKVTILARIRSDVQFMLVADQQAIEARPGDRAVLPVNLVNKGSDRLSLKFNASATSPDGWTAPEVHHGGFRLDELSGIGPGARIELEVVIKVPPFALRSDQVRLRLTAEKLSEYAGDVVSRENIDLSVIVAPIHELDLSGVPASVTLTPAEVSTIAVQVSNAGNGIERVRLLVEDVPAGIAVIEDPPLSLDMRANETLRVRLLPSADVPAGEHRIVLRIVTAEGHNATEGLVLGIRSRPRIAFEPLSRANVIPGRPEIIFVEATNIGNTALVLPPAWIAPAGWIVSANESHGSLDPRGSTPIAVHVLAPRGATAGTARILTDPSWAEGEPLLWVVQTIELHATVDRNGRDVIVDIENRGTGDATQVAVELSSGAQTLDKTIVPRVPAGGNSKVLFTPGDAGDLRIRIDSNAQFADLPSELLIDAASVNETPVGSLALLVATFAIAARIVDRDAVGRSRTRRP